jgi:hypothetical protein
MLRVYKAFRVVLTVALLAVFVALAAAVAIDAAGDSGVFEQFANQMDDNWSPIDLVESIPGFWHGLLFAIGLTGGMWLDPSIRSLSRRRSMRSKRRALEILYDPCDHRFVHREFENGQLKSTTCVNIAIHNGLRDTALQDVTISAGKNAFVKSMVEPKWGGSRIHHIDRIEPNATEFVQLFALAEDAPCSPKDVLGKVRRLVIRARAKNAKGTKARFKFDAHAVPILRRVS